MPRAQSDASVFTAIADPTRRAILELLRDGEMAAGDFHLPLGTSQSALSQHLGVLRSAGLVTQRREGRHQIYAIRAEPLRELFDWVSYFDRFWDRKLADLGRYLDRKN